MEKEFKIRNILFREDADGKKHILSSVSWQSRASFTFPPFVPGQDAIAKYINRLADAGCDVIVDDWSIDLEPVFQSGPMENGSSMSSRGVSSTLARRATLVISLPA